MIHTPPINPGNPPYSVGKRLMMVGLLLALVGPSFGRQANEWSREDLLNRGAVGLTDVLASLETMRYWSIDRFSGQFVDAGMGGAHATQPTIFVDGLPMTAPFIGQSSFDLVPIVTNDIASIRRTSGLNFLANGALSDGIIHIETVQPRGFSLRGSIGLINETGDPGPSLYSQPEARNVDRSGPTTGFRMSWGNANWYLQAGFDGNSYHLTDARIEGRVWRVFAGNRKPIVSHTTPHIRLRYSSNRTKASVWAGKTTKKNFLFDELAGQEWPFEEERTWFSAKITHSFPTGLDAELTSGYRRSITKNETSRISLPGSLNQLQAFSEAKIRNTWQRVSWYVSAGGQLNELAQNGETRTDRHLLAFTRTGLNVTISPRSSLSLKGGLRAPRKRIWDPTGWAHHSQLEFRRQKTSGGSFSASASLSNNFAAPLGSINGLIEAGVDFDEWASDVTPPSLTLRSQTIEVGFSSSSYVRPNVLLWVSLRARLLSGLTLPNRSFVQDQTELLFSSPTTYSVGQTGRVVSPSVGFKWKTKRSVTQVSYQYQRLITGENLHFWRNFVGLAPHHVSGSLLYSPTSRLHLFTAARISSRTRWPEYDMNGRNFQGHIVQIEGTISKQLWQENMRLGLSFLNVLDQPIIRHPAAVNEQFAVRLSIWVGFSDDNGSNKD